MSNNFHYCFLKTIYYYHITSFSMFLVFYSYKKGIFHNFFAYIIRLGVILNKQQTKDFGCTHLALLHDGFLYHMRDKSGFALEKLYKPLVLKNYQLKALELKDINIARFNRIFKIFEKKLLKKGTYSLIKAFGSFDFTNILPRKIGSLVGGFFDSIKQNTTGSFCSSFVLYVLYFSIDKQQVLLFKEEMLKYLAVHYEDTHIITRKNAQGVLTVNDCINELTPADIFCILANTSLYLDIKTI
jgi:hypothetical protein